MDASPQEARPFLSRWWFAICGLTLIVASDYKFRVRDPSTALAGAVDNAILVELLLYGMVAAYLVLVFVRRPRIQRFQPQLYLACFFVGLIVLSVAYTAYPEYALVRAGQMCVLAGLMLAAVGWATSADLHRFAHGFIALVAISVVYGIVIPSPPARWYTEGRFTWLAIHPTVSGVLTGLATVLVFGYLVYGRRSRSGPLWPRAVYLVLLGVVGGGLLATHTRGAVAGAVAGILVVLIVLRSGRALVEFLLACTIVTMGAAVAAGGVVVDYFEREETEEDLVTLNSRTNLWETAADAVEREPLFGYGVTSARGIFYDELGLGGGHNAVVNVFVELGLVGFVVWFALVVSVVGGVARLSIRGSPGRGFDRALLLGIVVFLLVDGIFFEGPGSVANVASTWFFVCIAWLMVLKRSTVAWSDETRAGAGTRVR